MPKILYDVARRPGPHTPGAGPQPPVAPTPPGGGRRARVTALAVAALAFGAPLARAAEAASADAAAHSTPSGDTWSLIFVFMLATFIGLGVIRRVSRLLHTPLMSITNAISAIAVVGAIIVAGGSGYPTWIRALGAVALFASVTNIVSGFMITDRMLKMFKSEPKAGAKGGEVQP